MFLFKSQMLEASDSTLIFFLLLDFFPLFLMCICGLHCCGGKPENVTPKYSRGSKSIAFLKESFLI